MDYTFQIYIFLLLFIQKVYITIIKRNILNENIKTTSYNKYLIYCKYNFFNIDA
jgi:hypothetical protein